MGDRQGCMSNPCREHITAQVKARTQSILSKHMVSVTLKSLQGRLQPAVRVAGWTPWRVLHQGRKVVWLESRMTPRREGRWDEQSDSGSGSLSIVVADPGARIACQEPWLCMLQRRNIQVDNQIQNNESLELTNNGPRQWITSCVRARSSCGFLHSLPEKWMQKRRSVVWPL